mgnify:CR=1 FL=1
MKLQYKDYGFYKINLDYLKYLHAVDDPTNIILIFHELIV